MTRLRRYAAERLRDQASRIDLALVLLLFVLACEALKLWAMEP